jgi:hypothetical protein
MNISLHRPVEAVYSFWSSGARCYLLYKLHASQPQLGEVRELGSHISEVGVAAMLIENHNVVD